MLRRAQKLLFAACRSLETQAPSQSIAAFSSTEAAAIALCKVQPRGKPRQLVIPILPAFVSRNSQGPVDRLADGKRPFAGGWYFSPSTSHDSLSLSPFRGHVTNCFSSTCRSGEVVQDGTELHFVFKGAFHNFSTKVKFRTHFPLTAPGWSGSMTCSCLIETHRKNELGFVCRRVSLG